MTNLTKNTIAFKKGFCLTEQTSSFTKESIEDNSQIVASLQSELMSFGFMLDMSAFNSMSSSSKNFIVNYYNEIIPYVKKVTGSDRNYKPFYKNFPDQVMEMTHYELFMNAIIHYISDGNWSPKQELLDRGFAFENVKFKIITLGNENDFRNIFKNIVSINNSITSDDKEIVEWFLDFYREGVILPEIIPFKETLIMLTSKGLDLTLSTTTDVLRLATYMSGGDISLPSIPKITITDVKKNRMSYFYDNLRNSQIQERESFKFKKFSRKERKLILSLLEKSNCNVEEMQMHLGRWIRLGEILHPGEYKQFTKVNSAFSKLRNQKEIKVRTFNSKVNSAFKEDWKTGVDLLATRPGEFARKLDWMIRSFDSSYVLTKFESIGGKISTKVLYELYNHFDGRSKNSTRMIMIKGKKSKMKILEPLTPMNQALIDRVKYSIEMNLKVNYAKLPKLGKVYIDENLKNIPLPFAMRSVNTSVKTFIRGTIIPFNPEAKVIRPFIHWFDEFGTQDLDLSAGLYDSDLKNLEHLSYTNLKSNRYDSCHSGDIRHKRGACAEYVDLNINKCLEKGVRYCIVQVHNFENEPMHQLKDCVFGLMEREYPKSNEIFVPKTISNCMSLSNESSTVIVCIIDLKEKCYIWCDIEMQSGGLSNFESSSNKSLDVMKGLLNMNKMNVYDLLKLHTDCRGQITNNIDDADIKFVYEDFYTDYIKIANFM